MGNNKFLKLSLIIIVPRLRLIKNQKTVSEVMIGRKLDDNMWHSISVLRITRLLNIKLDSEAERNILIPGFATDLNLNRILYVGGIGKQHMTPEGKITTKTKSDYKKKIPFRGCLRNIIIDNKEPLVALSRRNKNLVIYGVVTRPCHASEFNPIQFPNPQSLVDLVRIPSPLVEREMDIKLKFRTFDSEGTIVFAEGKRCHFILGVQKKQVNAISFFISLSLKFHTSNRNSSFAKVTNRCLAKHQMLTEKVKSQTTKI